MKEKSKMEILKSISFDVIDTNDSNQYDDLDYNNIGFVDARYATPLNPYDTANPFIAALPKPREERECYICYERSLDLYSAEQVKTMSKMERLIQIPMLRELRLPLPFHAQLEIEFYNAICLSYRRRYPIIYDIRGDDENEVKAGLVADANDGTNSAFAMIGFSGCGKSSALKILTQNYPQVIHHEFHGTRFVQITYIVVNCLPNSNFNALYISIARAIDRALGQADIFEAQIRKIRGLGAKSVKIQNLIEKFGVGVIVLDEIQLINFNQSNENSFESLMVISNNTGVGFAIVGTEDAYSKMFSIHRTARRIGRLINARTYCSNKPFFNFLLEKMWQYQFFDDPITLTKEVKEEMYRCTHGIIDQMIGLYQYLNYDYISSEKKPKFNAKYVRKVSEKYFPGLMKIMENSSDPEAEKKIQGLSEKAKEKIEQMSDKLLQEKISTDIINNNSDNTNLPEMKNYVIRVVLDCTDNYNVQTIQDIMSRVIKNNPSIDRRNLLRATLKNLEKKNKTGRKTKNLKVS